MLISCIVFKEYFYLSVGLKCSIWNWQVLANSLRYYLRRPTTEEGSFWDIILVKIKMIYVKVNLQFMITSISVLYMDKLLYTWKWNTSNFLSLLSTGLCQITIHEHNTTIERIPIPSCSRIRVFFYFILTFCA